jgi:AcrR family transcriptional regulator
MAKPTAKPSGRVHRTRVRRGNEDDARQLRTELLDAALAIFGSQGLDAVSIRAVAAAVGVSPMTPYRYFADKADLLSGLWRFALEALCEQLQTAIAGATGGRARQLAMIDAFLAFWEARPDHYRLVYTNDSPAAGQPPAHFLEAPVYARLIELVRGVTEGVAKEIGGDLGRAKLAGDIRFTMMLGYLHAMLITCRYPWSERALLRASYIEQIAASVERCLLQGKPAKSRSR